MNRCTRHSRAILAALLSLGAFGAARAEESLEVRREALRQELLGRHRGRTSIHRAYVARVGDAVQFEVELFRDADLWGLRVFKGDYEVGLSVSTRDALRLRTAGDRRIAGPGPETTNAHLRAYRAALAPLSPRFGPSLTDAGVAFGLTIGSDPVTDDIRFKSGLSLSSSAEPTWLEATWWKRFEGWDRSGSVVALRADADRVRVDETGALLDAAGVTRIERRRWTFDAQPPRWDFARWRVEIEQAVAAPVETDRSVAGEETALMLALGFASRNLGTEDPARLDAAARVLVDVRYPPVALQAMVESLSRAVEKSVPEVLDDPSNLKDGRRVLDEPKVRDVMREKAVQGLLDRLRLPVELFAVAREEHEGARRVERVHEAMLRVLGQRLRDALTRSTSPTPR